MYTQNTPVHVKLWRRDFWFMALANMLVTMAMYSQLPLVPVWLMSATGCQAMQAAIAVAMPVIGMFLPGCFCSFLVQHYRRNQVCIISILVVAACSYLLSCLNGSRLLATDGFAVVATIRLIQGAAYGLSQMVLSSTLIIDTCESFHRTEANHSAAWFSRFALALGPMAALATMHSAGYGATLFIGTVMCIMAVVLVFAVKFPFKAPEEVVRRISADRFFLPQGKWLFFNLLLITTITGLLFSIRHDITFYAMLTPGFLLALLAGRFVFVNADLKSEVTTGLILILAALFLMQSDNAEAAIFAAPVLIGCGIGIIGTRFLLFFIKLSPHCKRGTSQSTFFLAWESGLLLGLFIGYGFLYGNTHGIIWLAMAISAIALAMYLGFTHKWYMSHKNR